MYVVVCASAWMLWEGADGEVRLVSATLMCPAELQSQGREWDGRGVLTIVPSVCVCVEGSCDPQSEPLTNELFGLKFGIVNAV